MIMDKSSNTIWEKKGVFIILFEAPEYTMVSPFSNDGFLRFQVLANFTTCAATSKKGSRCMLPPIRGMPHCIHHATAQEKESYNRQTLAKVQEPQKCEGNIHCLSETVHLSDRNSVVIPSYGR